MTEAEAMNAALEKIEDAMSGSDALPSPTSALSRFWAMLSAVEGGTTAERLKALEACEVVKRMAGELHKAAKQLIMDDIKADGDFNYADKRWSVGQTKKQSVNDKAALLDSLLNACGGSVEDVANHLGSAAFKASACRKTLDKDFQKHFRTEIVQDIKTLKPKDELRTIPDNMVSDWRKKTIPVREIGGGS